MSNLEKELKGVIKEIEGSGKGHGTGRKKGSGKGGSSLEEKAKRLLE